MFHLSKSATLIFICLFWFFFFGRGVGKPCSLVCMSRTASERTVTNSYVLGQRLSCLRGHRDRGEMGRDISGRWQLVTECEQGYCTSTWAPFPASAWHTLLRRRTEAEADRRRPWPDTSPTASFSSSQGWRCQGGLGFVATNNPENVKHHPRPMRSPRADTLSHPPQSAAPRVAWNPRKGSGGGDPPGGDRRKIKTERVPETLQPVVGEGNGVGNWEGEREETDSLSPSLSPFLRGGCFCLRFGYCFGGRVERAGGCSPRSSSRGSASQQK